jgi:hypothetical protein
MKRTARKQQWKSPQPPPRRREAQARTRWQDPEVDDGVTLKKSVRSSLTPAHARDPLCGDAQRVQHPVQDRGEPTVVSCVNSKLNKWSHLQNNRKDGVSRLYLIR